MLKLILFGGKGGVGKTTFASSAGVYLAGKGKKTLLVSTDPAHSLSDSLGTQIGGAIKNAGVAGLDALEINAEKEFSAFKAQYDRQLRGLFETSSYLDSEDVDAILSQQLPGMDEVMGLKRVIELVREGEYDKYVVDTAPTGHALRLLHLPELLDQWIKAVSKIRWKYRYMVTRFSGSYRPDAADDLLVSMKKWVIHMGEALKDQRLCEFIAVTIPEAMAVEETARLIDSIRRYGIRIRHLIINNIFPMDSCAFCAEKRKGQERYIRAMKERFSFSGFELNVVEIPLQPNEIRGIEALKKIGGIAFAEHAPAV